MVESIKYEVLRQIEGLEIRRYPHNILATVYGHEDNDAFGILFAYITGANNGRRKVAMTVPVMSSEKSPEEIAMTTPVISDGSTFSFVIPSEYDINTVPRPTDERVKLVEIPKRTMAALRFSGRTTKGRVRQKTDELLKALEKAGLERDGEPYLMRYNSPFTPSFLRRNEVGVQIKTQSG